MNEILDEVSKILNQEKIKYEKEKLEQVAKYCNDIYDLDTLEYVIGVTREVALLRIDDTSIYASLLYKALKSKSYNKEEIKEKFGDEILEIIETIDKLSYLNYKKKDEIDNEILRNMFMAIAKDIRTVIIKLEDVLFNMRNIVKIKDESKKTALAKDCLKIYAPIAHRLGMSKVKSELEDISFRILMPSEYEMVKEQIDEKKQEREEYIKDRINEVQKVLKEQGIEAEIYGRPKHFYSIYKKMKDKKCRADDLFDLLAIRIIVSSIKDCYSVLGIVHDMYKPMPGRFKDYIAVPKTNMYQSLHTTVFGEGGRPFEIQIRTWDMHNVAERGIAAHFSYKEKSKKISEADKKIIWLRKALEIQQELIDNTENLENMKVELFGEEVFVFTPKGDIKALPKGSTPIDFAYSIHQKVAEKMIGAKINSRMVPLNTKLENTDVVEIVTSSNAKGPNRDWLKYVKTTSAKNKITAFLKKEGREVNILKGKEIFEKQLKKQRVSKDILTKDEYIKIMLKKSNFNSLDDCYENIGFGSVSPLKVINRLLEAYDESIKEKGEVKELKGLEKSKKVKTEDLVEVENINNCLIKFAKCCSPIPGDEIVGYITFSNGVSIHRKDCNNLKNLDINTRKINVKWKKQTKANFITHVRIKANDRDGILSDILKVLKDLKVDITEINTKVMPDKENVTDVHISIQDIEKLQTTIKNLKKIDSVFDVKRVR